MWNITVKEEKKYDCKNEWLMKSLVEIFLIKKIFEIWHKVENLLIVLKGSPCKMLSSLVFV